MSRADMEVLSDRYVSNLWSSQDGRVDDRSRNGRCNEATDPLYTVPTDPVPEGLALAIGKLNLTLPP